MNTIDEAGIIRISISICTVCVCVCYLRPVR